MNDALIRLASDALARPGRLPLQASERLRVQIDPLSGWARLRDGELLPPGTITLEHGTALETGTTLKPVQLTAFDLGRDSRDITLPLRRHLAAIDGEHCRFPGCDRTKNLHAHHVTFWSNGGRADLSNLVLVCSRHHTLIHSKGFQLVLSADRTLTVRTADDIPVPHHPTLPVGSRGDLTAVDADTLPPVLTQAMPDYAFAVYVIAQQAR